MDHALAVVPPRGRMHRLGVERVFEDILRADQLRRAMPGNEKAIGIGRVAHADVAEGIDDALMREDAVGERKLLAKGGKVVGHRMLLGTDRLVAALFYTNRPDLPPKSSAMA